MNPLIELKTMTLASLIATGIACFGLSPTSQAREKPDGDLGNGNTAEGAGALFSLTTGANNTAIGFNTLFSVTTGNNNTAIGFSALANITFVGDINNTATGAFALANNGGQANTATGVNALANNLGNANTASGFNALPNNSGNSNTAIGAQALVFNTTGERNIGIGVGAGSQIVAGTNNIDIGDTLGVADESGTIRIGGPTQHATYIAGISGATVLGGVTVIVDADGQLGTIVSSARFKETIKPMNKASEAILALKPVTFRYKKDLDPKSIPQFGLVAEDIEKVNPDLITRDPKGKPYTVRYEAVNAMLLNEFLKEHRKVEKQQEEIDALKAELKEQKALIQKVSDEVELNKPALQMVVNDR
jgi:Chaperone of endosialidase